MFFYPQNVSTRLKLLLSIPFVCLNTSFFHSSPTIFFGSMLGFDEGGSFLKLFFNSAVAVGAGKSRDIPILCNTGAWTNADLFLPKQVLLNDAWQLSLEKLALVQKQQASLKKPSYPCVALCNAAELDVSVPILCCVDIPAKIT